jgi:hypothetical protein
MCRLESLCDVEGYFSRGVVWLIDEKNTGGLDQPIKEATGLPLSETRLFSPSRRCNLLTF